jgi:hypothetical protein
MEKQAAEVLGEPVMDGLILLARGAARKIRKDIAPAALGGLTGSLARVAADKMTKDTSPTDEVSNPDLRGGFLALTASSVVLFDTEDGRFRQKLGREIARFAPGDLATVELGAAATGVGTVDLIDRSGKRWVYEYSKVMGRKLNRIAEAAQANVVDVG